jgi:hypothetical protein
MIWHENIWYDMINYMIYDMKCNYMICYDIWYDMIWKDMICYKKKYEMIWNEKKRYMKWKEI